MSGLEGTEIAWAAQLACLLEVSAEKPGNVSAVSSFSDVRYEDFLASAVAIGPTFAVAPRASVGETVLRSVQATRRLVSTNTNLGILLLFAPLAKAAGSASAEEGLRLAVTDVLDRLTVEDTREAYDAIRLASPSGLGTVDRYDVSSENVDVTLGQVMESARDRDSIACEYATGFEITFEVGYESLRRALDDGHELSHSITYAFLTILSQLPDTLIARKAGRTVAEEVSRRAMKVLAVGGPFLPRGRAELACLDRDLRDESHKLNPGTTADLVAASLFVLLLEWRLWSRMSNLEPPWSAHGRAKRPGI